MAIKRFLVVYIAPVANGYSYNEIEVETKANLLKPRSKEWEEFKNDLSKDLNLIPQNIIILNIVRMKK